MKKLYSVLLFLISATLFAQTYTITTFNTNNSGIAANNVNDFKRSSSGTLWIATNNGLSAMVGNNFTNYTVSNSAIPTNMLTKIAVSGSNVWASTYQEGLVYRNGNTGAFSHYTMSNSAIPNNVPNGIATDGLGNLWMASSSGLTKFNGTTWTTYNTSNSQIGSNDVTSVAVDASNNVWVSAGGMLSKFNGNTFTSITDGVSKILKVTTGAIYVDIGDGLGKIVGTDYESIYWTNSSCLASCNIEAVGVDETNKVWLGLDSCGNYAGGIQNFTNCTTYTTSNSVLPHDSITSLLVVDSNVIWAGTLEGGLVRMNRADDSTCNPPTGLNVPQFGQTSAYLDWTSANPAPGQGYNYRYNTVNNVTGAIESHTYETSAGIDQLQPNTTYYWWVASVCEPLTWVSGGSFTTEPAPVNVCNPPTGLNVAQFGQTSASLAWTAANPAPAGGYLYRYNTVNNVAGAIESSTSQTGAGIDQLQPNTTYYWWVAPVCEPLNWVSGGSFTTQAASGCTEAQYGLWPTGIFTPGCTGTNEVININAWAGEYNNVNIVAGKLYTFTSSVATDYITITNATGLVYASGQTPLNWASGTTSGVIRYYIHTNANCGSQNIDRTRYIKCADSAVSTCGAPTALSVTNITSNSSRLNWNAPATAPAFYELYIVTANTAPGINTQATVTSNTAGIGVLSGLAPATTYYYWIRSNCGSVKSAWVSGGNFTTNAALTCNGASNGLYPEATFTPACTGSNEQIAADAYAGEYSNVNAAANKQYTFTSSVTTDYITITNAAGTVVYASGQTPLSWASGATSGIIRYYIHANVNCGSQNTSRIRSVKCVEAPVSTCGVPTALSVSNITSNSVRLSWTAPATAASSYDIYIITTNTAPVANTAATLTNNTAIIRALSGLSPSTTYYYWIRSNCGSAKSAWVSGGSFSTLPALGCNGASYGLFPDETFTPACTGVNELIRGDSWAGEYANLNISANKEYTFSTSVATDYVTITNAAGTVVYASGATPLNWSSGNTSGVIRYYLHASAFCAEQTVLRSRFIKCVNTPATCAVPTSLAVSNITSNSVRVDWVSGVNYYVTYDIYYSTSNIAPVAGTTPTIPNQTNTRVLLNGLTGSTTYYFWVRTICSLNSKSEWVPISFTTIPTLACNGATNGLYPATTFTPSCTGSNEVINTDGFGGDYSNINVVANKQYTFSSSIATDYITVTNATGTVVYATGQTPVVWLSGNTSGVVRAYLHTNANCGDQNTVGRTRYVKCANVPVAVCGMPSELYVSNVTSNSARIWWTAPATAPSHYEVYISTNSMWPEYNANPTATAMSSVLTSYSPLAASTTYYYWVRSVCGSAKSDWTTGGSFTTLPALVCNGAYFGLYPEDTVMLQNTGTPEPVAYQAMAGQYSNVSVTANKQYQFTSSMATDYITITNEAGTITLASGQTPLTWTSGNTPSTVRFYLHANANCGDDDMPRDKFVKAITLGLTDYLANSHFRIYPNPSMGHFNVDTGNDIADRIMIFDNVGRLISTHLPVAAKTILTIDGLSDGVYYIKVYYQDKSLTEKLVLKKN